MFTAYNAVLRNVIRDLPGPYQTIVNEVISADHDCSVLALGSCNICTSYLAFRYGSIALVRAQNDEYNFMKELSLSFHAATAFIKDRHITPQIRRAQEDKRQVLSTLPRQTSNAPCVRQHLEEHTCPAPAPCTQEHLVDHTCPPCEEEHLEDHQCTEPEPEPCTQEHLNEHTCPTTCNEPHLRDHQCPIIDRDPLGHVCYHLECLGPCRVSPSPHVPQINIQSMPGAFNSFATMSNELERALSAIVEEPQFEQEPESSTSASQNTVTADLDPTICQNCQHLLDSRHHRYECPSAIPRPPSPVFSEPETTTSMSTATRRVVRHRRRVRHADGTYTFDGRRLPAGMNRPLSIPASHLQNISNLDHSESSEEEYEIETPSVIRESASPAAETVVDEDRPVTPPTFVTHSTLFGTTAQDPTPTPAPTLPSRDQFVRNPLFSAPTSLEEAGIIRNPVLRDFAPVRRRTAQPSIFGLTSPAPSSSSSTTNPLFGGTD